VGVAYTTHSTICQHVNKNSLLDSLCLSESWRINPFTISKLGHYRRAPLRVVDQEVPCLVALVASLPPRLSALPLPDYGKISTFCAGISQTAPSVGSTLGIHDWKERTNGGDDTSVDRNGETRRGREGLVRRVTLLSRGEALTGTINGADKPHTGG
jgi:hypothetical protein